MMVQIRYYKSKGVSKAMLFKILNDTELCTLSDSGNTVLTTLFQVK